MIQKEKQLKKIDDAPFSNIIYFWLRDSGGLKTGGLKTCYFKLQKRRKACMYL